MGDGFMSVWRWLYGLFFILSALAASVETFRLLLGWTDWHELAGTIAIVQFFVLIEFLNDHPRFKT